MKKEIFSIDFKNTKLVGDIIFSDNHSDWLFLHGAGQADRKRFEKMRKIFGAENISSCAFDFIGHGESMGNLMESSLEDKTNQALAVIESQKIHQPISIVAASMSGYIAIKLTESYKIDNLVFLAPAVYTQKVYSTFFGPEFAKMIQEPNSWEKTDAWGIIKKYKGNLLIFVAENDQIVPKELTEKLYQSAEQANFKKIITVKNATHPLGKWLDEHPNDLKLVFNEIIKMIKK